MMNSLIIDKIIIDALKEDIPNEDITTNSVVSEDSKSTVDLIGKEKGILAGLKIFERVFALLGDVTVKFFKSDGDKVEANTLIATLTGNTRSLLKGERTALNILQRMCGVATLTNQCVDQLQGTHAKLVDTRKTTPNMRILEKYAVKIGGGMNHRFNLSDGILLKDNHISAAGGILNAVKMAREGSSFVRKVEVEVESLDMVKEALAAKADIIMLDNMNLETMRTAVEIIDKKAEIEASGNVTLDTIRDIGMIGVDYISSGAVTHSYKSLDISMKNLKNIMR